MANVLSAFGFLSEGTVSGAAPNWRLSKRLIASSNATAIYSGDAVVPVTSSVTGYITQATASTVAMAGIFYGCEYTSVSQGNLVRSRYWPGSDANGDVTAYVIDNPDAVFLVQSSYASAAIGLAAINMNVQLSVGTGSTLTGQSGMSITGAAATTSTYPFTVVGVVTDPPGANGTDLTTPYNYVLVTFNNEIFRAGLTSVS